MPLIVCGIFQMHIVHIKEPYDTVEEVKNMADGLAVIGVFLDIGESTNLAVQKVLDSAGNLSKAGRRHQFFTVSL